MPLAGAPGAGLGEALLAAPEGALGSPKTSLQEELAGAALASEELVGSDFN